MTTRLLDDLARSLAEPMPRRRALRLLGTTLVAVVVPGLGPKGARAGVRRSAKCGPDQRVCREFTQEEYCCPRPSWQFFCGSKRGQCLNTCTGGTKFPCTALIEHPESGINGLCCDRRLHSRCNPVGRAPTRWKPECVPCLGTACGPNRKYGEGHPQRWTCCTKPNVCRKGVCRCPDGKLSCGGTDCCKRSKVCKQCADADSGEVRVTGTVKCCGRDEFCCVDKCCDQRGACCNGKCCPPGTQCARKGGFSVDACCPQSRVFAGPDRNYCCPPGTEPGEQGCCKPGDATCCASAKCPSGAYCVRGTCVR